MRKLFVGKNMSISTYHSYLEKMWRAENMTMDQNYWTPDVFSAFRHFPLAKLVTNVGLELKPGTYNGYCH